VSRTLHARRSLVTFGAFAWAATTLTGAYAQPDASATAALPPVPAPDAPTNPPQPTTPTGDAPAAPRPGQCVERLPSGRARPKVVEAFPARGLAGYAAELVVEVDHLRGERLLPGGLHLEAQSDEARLLEQAHFILPHAASAAAPRLESAEKDGGTRSKLVLPLVPLPSEPGRRELVLPSLPIAMARASGEVFVLCTAPHTITIEDPIANEPSPEPRANPAPRRQLEVWQAAKTALLVGVLALASGALFAWLFTRWRKRPRRGPPPPPPRPPWEVADESLRDIESSGLIRAGRFDEHFDRVSQTIRRYLGDRYGFDGLESTSREALRVLQAITPTVPELGGIKRFLQHADLVKFARLTPSEDECRDYLAKARHIVTRTVPHSMPGNDGAPPTDGVPPSTDGAPPSTSSDYAPPSKEQGS
jgi:hypothetical protein